MKLFNLPVITNVRPEIGIAKELKNNILSIEYPTLGFTEAVNTHLNRIKYIPTITDEQYQSAWECMPPIRITGCKEFAFAPNEPYSHTSNGVTYVCYSLINEQYFKIIATLEDATKIFNAMSN